MSQSAEINKGESAQAAGTLPPIQAPVSCRKKKSEVDEGFVKDMITHIDEFVNASYDEHKSCLQKTVRKLFGVNRAVEAANSRSASSEAPPPVVSNLPLRAETAPQN